MNEALALYGGPFLADDDEHASYAVRRDALRGRLCRSLARLVRRHEDAGQSDAAIDLCLRAIDADDSYEPLHRLLMQVHLRLGEPAEAQAACRRLQCVLAVQAGRDVSPETLALLAGPGPSR
jgi:DNA-binding SARP family transcriptional activator